MDTSSLEDVLKNILNCGCYDVWENLFGLLARVLPRQPLREFGVDKARCREMAELATQGQQRCPNGNPLQISREVIEDIYQKCI